MSDIIDEINERVMMDEFVKVNKIYLDIHFIKYLGLGKLLAHPKMTSDIYDDIYAYLSTDAFKDRITDIPSDVFSSILDKYPDLSEAYSTDKDDALLVMSPTFQNVFEPIMKHIVEAKHAHTVIGTDDDIRIMLDIGDLQLSDTMLERVAIEYSDLFKVPVIILNESLTDISDTDILKYDSYFINAFHIFNNRYIKLLDDRKMVDKYLFKIGRASCRERV